MDTKPNKELREKNKKILSDLESQVKVDLIDKYNQGLNFFDYHGEYMRGFMSLLYKDDWVKDNCENPIEHTHLTRCKDNIPYAYCVVVQFKEGE